ncbi:MAG: hypothetical protein V4488_07205 [Pseudomonadota bacterium]
MDMYLVSAVSKALKSAQELGQKALSVREQDQLTLLLAQLNKQLDSAERALSLHKRELISAREEFDNTRSRLRKMEMAIATHQGYQLVELTTGFFAYKPQGRFALANKADNQANLTQYLCQPCLECGLKSALETHTATGAISYLCPICKRNSAAAKLRLHTTVDLRASYVLPHNEII